jgi:hypothetical protein
MENIAVPINHTKLLRESGFKFIKYNIFLPPTPAAFIYGRRSALGTSEGLPRV